MGVRSLKKECWLAFGMWEKRMKHKIKAIKVTFNSCYWKVTIHEIGNNYKKIILKWIN